MKRPTPLKNILGSNHQNLRRLAGNVRQLEQLNKRLARVLPASTCKHCQITRISEQTLVLHCDSAAWATRIRFEQSRVIKAFRDLNINAVAIHIAQTRTHQAEQAPPQERKISTEAAALVARLADNTRDGPLKTALQRLAQRGK